MLLDNIWISLILVRLTSSFRSTVDQGRGWLITSEEKEVGEVFGIGLRIRLHHVINSFICQIPEHTRFISSICNAHKTK